MEDGLASPPLLLRVILHHRLPSLPKPPKRGGDEDWSHPREEHVAKDKWKSSTTCTNELRKDGAASPDGATSQSEEENGSAARHRPHFIWHEHAVRLVSNMKIKHKAVLGVLSKQSLPLLLMSRKGTWRSVWNHFFHI